MTKPSAPKMTELAFGGLLALAIGLGISRFVFTPILPFMEEGLGLGKSDAGLIASANFLGYLIGALLAIRQSLPGSLRFWFLSALMVCALTTGLMGLTDSLPVFLVLRFVGGVASAIVMIFGTTLILSRFAAEGRSSLTSLYFAGVGVGISLSSLLIMALISYGADWQEMWIWGGALSGLLLLPVFWLVPRDGKSADAAITPPRLIFSPRLKALILSYFLLGFGYIITATFISALVRHIPGLQWMQTPVWLVVGLAGIPSVPIWSWVGRRLGNHNSYAIASLCLAVGVASSVFAASEGAVFLSALLLGGTFMGMSAVGLVHSREILPDNARQILAVMTLAFGLGQTIGPVFAGYAYDYFGNFVAASLIAAVGLVVAALLTGRVNVAPLQSSER